MVTHAFTDYTFYSITIISVYTYMYIVQQPINVRKISLFIKQFDRLCFFLIFTFM